MAAPGGDASDGRRWRRRKTLGTVHRKILRATRVLTYIYLVAGVSSLMSLIGILLYLFVSPSKVVLVEAFVWLVEAISFAGLAVAFKIAASRTMYYRARFEILRMEALASFHLALIGLAITLFIAYKAVTGGKGEPTPVLLSLYPLGSAVMSYLLSRMLHEKLHKLELQIVSIRVVEEKLKFDVLLEAAGGFAIILSNMVHQPLIETGIVVLVALYVVYGLGSLALHNLMYLVGPGPRSERERVSRQIRIVLERENYRAKRIRVESYGTFSEAEVWLEYPSDVDLGTAYAEGSRIARLLVRSVPELLRALVILVPVKSRVVTRYRRTGQAAARRGPEGEGSRTPGASEGSLGESSGAGGGRGGEREG